MLRIGLFCMLAVTVTTGYQYSPFCQNWCYGQQTAVQPQVCGSYCGGYTGGYGSCCPGYPSYPYPVNPINYPGNPINYPGNPTNYPGNPINYPGNPTNYPGNPVGPVGWPRWPVVIVDPNVPTSTDPIKVVVDTNNQKPTEWVCPVDPQPRASAITGNVPATLVACEYDENCVSAPVRHKCCYDSGVAAKVCKPAIPA